MPPGVPAVIAIVFIVPPAGAKANAVAPWSASPAAFAEAFQSMLYELGLFVVAVYGSVAFCTAALKHKAFIVPTVVIVGGGLIIIDTIKPAKWI